MTAKARLLTGFLVVAVVIVVIVVAAAVQNSLTVSISTADTESAFFRSFTPDNVVKRFSCQSGMSLSGGSAGAEIGYATHEKDFDQYFAIQANDWLPLITSLHEDVSSQLRADGAQLLRESGSLAEGFRVEYKIGKSRGVVGVEPLKTVDASTHVLGSRGGCKGGIAVRLRLSVEEKYYQKERALPAELLLPPN